MKQRDRHKMQSYHFPYVQCEQHTRKSLRCATIAQAQYQQSSQTTYAAYIATGFGTNVLAGNLKSAVLFTSKAEIQPMNQQKSNHNHELNQPINHEEDYNNRYPTYVYHSWLLAGERTERLPQDWWRI
jgi:hypothetical protein